MTKLSELPLLPADPIYGMQALFKNDTRPNKCNLSIGVCQDSDGNVLRFKAAALAEDQVHAKLFSKEYLPLTGLAPFCQAIQELVCGKNEAVTTVQTVGGTGALYVASRLLRDAEVLTVFIPEPTWINHRPLLSAAGLDVFTYPYYDKEQASIDFTKMCDAIRNMAPRSAIVLQASCHNPTGADLTAGQFRTLSELVKERELIPLFDLAYQGLGDGLVEDTVGIRIFLEDAHEMMVATTFAKSFGIYNERMGALLVAAPKPCHESIVSHIRAIVRSCYSSPPAHGAHIINTILSDPRLYRLWEKELADIRERLSAQRALICKELDKKPPHFAYKHLLDTKGLFCLFDITQKEVDFLRNEKALYIANDGRICISAITDQNAAFIAQCLSSL